MYSFRRSASRFLALRPASVVSPLRTYASFTTPSRQIVKRASVFQSQRRWATSAGEKEVEAPISKLQATGPEEVENEIHSEAASEVPESQGGASPSAVDASIDSASTVVESANFTEATEETIPAAETNERPSATEGIVAEESTTDKTLNFGADSLQKKQTIYIGNLFFDVTESDIIKEFTRFGSVTKAKVVRDSRGLSKGFAYVDFATTEAAEDAVRNMNMQLYEGRRMTVQYAARPSYEAQRGDRQEARPLNPPSKTLFIGNMSFEMTDRDLSNLFRGIRNVIDVRVAIDRRTGQPRGFAHADFIDVKSAMEALKVLKDKETYGRRLRLDYSYSSSQAPRNQGANSTTNPPLSPEES